MKQLSGTSMLFHCVTPNGIKRIEFFEVSLGVYNLALINVLPSIQVPHKTPLSCFNLFVLMWNSFSIFSFSDHQKGAPMQDISK